MQPFGAAMSSQDLANVLTFVRNSWGNEAPMITKEMVQKVRDEEKELRKNLIKNYQTASDAEVQKTIDRMFDLEQSVLDIKRKYYKEFAKVIPVKKVALIPKADREFQQEVLKRMRQMRNNGGQ